MRFWALGPMAVLVLSLAGCASHGAVSPAATPSAPPGTGTRIEISLTDAMRIEPSTLTVPLGEPVTFVVTNTGQIEHEFYLGNEAAQEEHDQEMLSGVPMHEHSNAVAVAPGGTEELTYTFTRGEWLAGCHVPGHYPAGMKATITVTE